MPQYKKTKHPQWYEVSDHGSWIMDQLLLIKRTSACSLLAPASGRQTHGQFPAGDKTIQPLDLIFILPVSNISNKMR